MGMTALGVLGWAQVYFPELAYKLTQSTILLGCHSLSGSDKRKRKDKNQEGTLRYL